MVMTGKAPIVTVMLILSSAVKANDCRFPTLAREHRDIATIQVLELEWTRAYLRGDTDFEECLLTPDFTEIMRNGDIKDLSAELALAAKNKAKPLPLGNLPSGQVLLHGNVAVAYGRSTGARAMRYADYYVWENGRWRVYFAQQTEIAADPHSD
ncbi:MAG TPA: nuclear transport factor 2 family protein [Steroidobacteraceae bacterium]